jgi:hypothetical protein
LEASISPTVKRISLLEDRVSPTVKWISPLEEWISPLEEWVSPLEEWVSPLEEWVSPLEERISPLVKWVLPLEESISPEAVARPGSGCSQCGVNVRPKNRETASMGHLILTPLACGLKVCLGAGGGGLRRFFLTCWRRLWIAVRAIKLGIF